MLSFRGRANREKLAMIVDIDTGSVAAGVVALHETGPANVITAQRSYLKIEDRTPEHLSVATVTLLSELIPQVLASYEQSPARHGSIGSVYVIIGSPWVRSRSSVATEKFPQEKNVTQTLIQDIAKQALKAPSELDPAHVFESSVTRVQLNGYPAPNPVGKKAHHISVTTLQSDIESTFKKDLDDTLSRLLPGRKIDFRSDTRAALSTLHQRTHANHYLYISIGATSTDCVAVHKEDTNEHLIIPIGTSTIAQRLAGEVGSPDEVLSLLHMLASDVCNAPSCGALKTSLAKVESELVKAFGDAFASIASRRKIPNVCFLATHVDFAPWLEYFFTRIDFAQFTVTAQPFSIELLSPTHVRDKVTWSTEAKEDTDFGLAAAFVNTISH